jgi:hypothetical protein
MNRWYEKVLGVVRKKVRAIVREELKSRKKSQPKKKWIGLYKDEYHLDAFSDVDRIKQVLDLFERIDEFDKIFNDAWNSIPTPKLQSVPETSVTAKELEEIQNEVKKYSTRKFRNTDFSRIKV